MRFPDSKNVIFISFLLRPNFSPKISGLPDFYSVKLDVIGLGQKPHFWNQETSCSNTPYLVLQEEQGPYLRRVKMTRGEGEEEKRKGGKSLSYSARRTPIKMQRGKITTFSLTATSLSENKSSSLS